MDKLIRFLKDEGGATAIEYGLIAALISVVIIVALTAAGGQLKLVFERVKTELESALGSGDGGGGG